MEAYLRRLTCETVRSVPVVAVELLEELPLEELPEDVELLEAVPLASANSTGCVAGPAEPSGSSLLAFWNLYTALWVWLP